MTIKLFVGYRTKLIDNVEALLPDIKPARNLVDKKKIAEDISARKAAFLEAAASMPYTSTLDEVFLIDPAHKKGLQYVADPKRPPPSVRVRNYLLKAYPNAWSEDTHDTRKPEAIFMGFDPKTFLKILGLECSLPEIGLPLPARLWYANSDHRDIAEAVAPDHFKKLELSVALKRRRPRDEKSAAAWDALFKDWPGPGVFPEKDATITLELAVQLGFEPF